MKKLVCTVLAIVVIIMAAACDKKEAAAPAGKHKLTVITTLFPLYDFARTVAGDKAEVTLLLPPGVEAHSFEPKPMDMARISKADVIVYTNEFMEPWAAKLLRTGAPQATIVDSSAGLKLRRLGAAEKEDEGHGAHADHDHEAGGLDPHIWLDFANAQAMVDNIAKGLSTKDPANKEYYLAHAAGYKEELKKLDAEYKAGLANCRRRLFLHGGHYAFGYLAARYGLSYESAQAVNPDSEPTPEKLASLVKLMRQNQIKYVYAEELLSPATSEMLAKETGATVLLLNAAHNVSRDDLEKGVSFISLMRKNLENLRVGLECK